MAVVAISAAWSDACYRGGDGQCDGIIPDDEHLPHGVTDECMCECHSAWYGPFSSLLTVEAMAKAHADYWAEG